MRVIDPTTTTPAAFLPPGIWRVDAARSTVGFAVRHLKLTKVRGRFLTVEGVLSCDATGALSITGSIAVASIDTGDPRRDARLCDVDFFDVRRYPAITVSAASPPAPAGDAFTVRSTMTIRGVQREVELLAEPPARSSNGLGELRVRARGELSRRAFGLDWDPAFAAGRLVIDDRVALLLDVLIIPVAHALAADGRARR